MSLSSTSGGEGPKVFSIPIGEWVPADVVGITQDGDVIVEYQERGSLQRQVMKSNSKFVRLPSCLGFIRSDSSDGCKFGQVTVGGTAFDACTNSFDDCGHFREASLVCADPFDYPEVCTGAQREYSDSYIEANPQWAVQRDYTRSDSELFVAAPREREGFGVKANSHGYTRLDSELYVAAPGECGGHDVKASSPVEELSDYAVSDPCFRAAAPTEFCEPYVDSTSRKELSEDLAISESNSGVVAPKPCGDLFVSATSPREEPQDHAGVSAFLADDEDGGLKEFVQMQNVSPPPPTQKVFSALALEPTGKVGYPGLLRDLEKKLTGLDDVDVSDLMGKFENDMFKNDRALRSQIMRTGIEEGIVPLRTDDIERKIVEHSK